MKSRSKSNSSINNSLINQKGETTMKNLTSQIGNIITYSSDPTYLPLRIEQIEHIKLSDIPIGTEVLIYDSIINNRFTLQGMRISIKKEYVSRVVIGCVECPEYMVIEDEELENISCENLIEDFLELVNTNISLSNRIAA